MKSNIKSFRHETAVILRIGEKKLLKKLQKKLDEFEEGVESKCNPEEESTLQKNIIKTKSGAAIILEKSQPPPPYQ